MAVRPVGSSWWPDNRISTNEATRATMEPPEPEGSSGSIAMYTPLPAMGSNPGGGGMITRRATGWRSGSELATIAA
jgi:hypothetical protein